MPRDSAALLDITKAARLVNEFTGGKTTACVFASIRKAS